MAKDLNCEETGKKHHLKVSSPARPVHVVSANVHGDSFLFKLSSSHRISALVNVEGGGTIPYQGGVLAQLPQCSKCSKVDGGVVFISSSYFYLRLS